MKDTRKKALGAALLSQLFIFCAQMIISAFFPPSISMSAYLTFSCISSLAVFGIPVIVYSILTGRSPISYENSPFKAKDRTHNGENRLLLFVFAVAITVTVVNLLGTLTSYLLTLMGSEISETAPTTVTEFILYFIRNVLLAAFLEELVFRGMVLDAYSEHGKVKKILLSSLFFALMHCSMLQLPYAFAAGALIAYFTLKTGSLLFAFGVHLVQNFVSFAFTALSALLPNELYNSASNIVFVIFSVVALIGAVYIILDEIKASKSVSSSPATEKTKETALTVGLILYIAMTAILSALTI